jgi:hypothetical protein
MGAPHHLGEPVAAVAEPGDSVSLRVSFHTPAIGSPVVTV